MHTIFASNQKQDRQELFIEQIPISRDEYIAAYCGDKEPEEDEHFYLEISIKTEFVVRSELSPKRARYSGVLGAILLQKESELRELEEENETLRQDNHDSQQQGIGYDQAVTQFDDAHCDALKEIQYQLTRLGDRGDEIERLKMNNVDLLNKVRSLRSQNAILKSQFEALTAEFRRLYDAEFEHRTARAWRYDTEQEKWRGRGLGKVIVYCNKERKLRKLVFVDEQHDDKVRLLQWINGDEHFHQSAAAGALSFEWFGADYSMDQNQPMVGKWKIDFMDDEDAANRFVAIWRNTIGLNYKARISPIDSAKDFEAGDKRENDEKEDIETRERDSVTSQSSSQIAVDGFSWNWTGSVADELHDNQCEHSDANGWVDVAGNFSSGEPTKRVVDENEESVGGFESFNNISFKYDRIKNAEQATDEETVRAFTQNAENAKDEIDTKKKRGRMIIRVPDCIVGTEEDTPMQSFEIIKLYRWTEDASGDSFWKNRANDARIDFWQQPSNGKVRLICRENATNKVKMNHRVPSSKIANAQLRAEKFVQWSGFDTTSHVKDEDDNNGLYMFNAKFKNANTAVDFYDLLVESIENNEKLDKQ